MTKYPSSKDELELGHHVVYYTFLPLVAIVFGTILSSPVLWWMDYLSYSMAFVLPWTAMLVTCLYIMCFADYVIPIETYRKLRSGEWGESE